MKEKIEQARRKLNDQRDVPRNTRPISFDTPDIKQAAEDALSSFGRVEIRDAGSGSLVIKVDPGRGGPPGAVQLKDLSNAFREAEKMVQNASGIEEVTASLVRMEQGVFDITIVASG